MGPPSSQALRRPRRAQLPAANTSPGAPRPQTPRPDLTPPPTVRSGRRLLGTCEPRAQGAAGALRPRADGESSALTESTEWKEGSYWLRENERLLLHAAREPPAGATLTAASPVPTPAGRGPRSIIREKHEKVGDMDGGLAEDTAWGQPCGHGDRGLGTESPASKGEAGGRRTRRGAGAQAVAWTGHRVAAGKMLRPPDS